MIFKEHRSWVPTDLLGLCENPGGAVARLVQAEREDGVGARRLLHPAHLAALPGGHLLSRNTSQLGQSVG